MDPRREPGFGSGFGPGRHRHGIRRMRRGDVRTAVLAVLVERPGHGYEIIQALEEKSGGAWRPSPGSIYPTLQQLEDEGLVRSATTEGKRVYELTDEGKAEAERRLAEAGRPPWDDAGSGDLRSSLRQFVLAYKQIESAGSAPQAEKAAQIMNDARKQLYRLLAED
jgi:DNA-binding PadR family transcriptional regulator